MPMHVATHTMVTHNHALQPGATYRLTGPPAATYGPAEDPATAARGDGERRRGTGPGLGERDLRTGGDRLDMLTRHVLPVSSQLSTVEIFVVTTT